MLKKVKGINEGENLTTEKIFNLTINEIFKLSVQDQNKSEALIN